MKKHKSAPRTSVSRATRAVYLVLQIIAGIVFIEAGLRLFPSYVSLGLAEYLPAEAASYLAAYHAQNTKDMLKGEGMLYTNDPAAGSLLPHPVDANGYRNPDVPKEPLDIVFLGDSIFLADSEPRDLGQVFRDHGYRAYNIAMGAYGPLHYRDAFRKYILAKGVRYRCLVAAFNSGTEYSDTDTYVKVRDGGGDWRDLVGISKEPPPIPSGGLWSLGLVASLPRMAAGAFKRETTPEFASPMTVALPYLRFTADAGLLHYLNIMPLHPASIAVAMDAYRDIAGEVGRTGGRMFLAGLPQWALLFEPYVLGHEDERLLMAMTYQWGFDNVDFELKNYGVTSFDAREGLTPALLRELITVSPDNVHLNDHGLEALYEYLAPRLEGCRE